VGGVVVEEKQEPEKENNGEEVVYFLEALAPTSSTARPGSCIANTSSAFST
jgi:hypothetical protein